MCEKLTRGENYMEKGFFSIPYAHISRKINETNIFGKNIFLFQKKPKSLGMKK